jgi:hypothetical protein
MNRFAAPHVLNDEHGFPTWGQAGQKEDTQKTKKQHPQND